MQIVEKILKIPKTKDASISSVGGEIVITDSYNHKLKDVEIGGNTFQQTYTGKNLINLNGTIVKREVASYSNISTANNTLSYSITTSTTGYLGFVIPVEIGTTYTISFTNLRGNIYRVELDEAITQVGTNYGGTVLSGAYYTATKPYVGIWLQCPTNIGSASVSNLQFETGSSKTSYEPYVGGKASPSPDFPQEVQNVSGEVEVKVANGSDSSAEGYEEQNVTLQLPEGMELCKIGNYQDSIIKQNGKWYKNKNINKVTLNGTENWNTRTNNSGRSQFYCTTTATYIKKNDYSAGLIQMCNYDVYSYITYNQGTDNSFVLLYNTKELFLNKGNTSMSVDDWKTKLSQQNLDLYYVRSSSTLEEITDATLIEQLDNLSNLYSYDGTTIISIDANLTPTISIDYYKNRPVHKYITNKAYYDYMQDIVY